MEIPDLETWYIKFETALRNSGISEEIMVTEGDLAWWLEVQRDDAQYGKVRLALIIGPNPEVSSWSLVCKIGHERDGYGWLKPDTDLDQLIQKAFSEGFK